MDTKTSNFVESKTVSPPDYVRVLLKVFICPGSSRGLTRPKYSVNVVCEKNYGCHELPTNFVDITSLRKYWFGASEQN